MSLSLTGTARFGLHPKRCEVQRFDGAAFDGKEGRLVRRIALIVICFAALLVGAFFIHRKFRSDTPVQAIPTAGGEPLQLQPLKTSHFLQTDPRWAKDQIGGSGEPLSKVGCTICCVARVFDAHGIPVTPATLNEALKRSDGYTASGLLKWDSLTAVSQGKVRPSYIGRPDAGKIDEALRNGQPVIAKVMLRNVVQHWVLIVGKRGTEYLVRDPLNSDMTTLSAVANTIYAIRILKPE